MYILRRTDGKNSPPKRADIDVHVKGDIQLELSMSVVAISLEVHGEKRYWSLVRTYDRCTLLSNYKKTHYMNNVIFSKLSQHKVDHFTIVNTLECIHGLDLSKCI
jgi:hypothetical protein